MSDIDSDGPHVAVLNKIREKCLKRGPAGIKSIARTFSLYDDNNSKLLEVDELIKGLHDYQVDISPQEVNALMAYFDRDGSGSLDFDEFLQMLRPPMSDGRVQIINKVFKKLDKSGDGVVTVADMKGVYNARKHPKYMNGDWDEIRVFQEYLKSFEPDEASRDGTVTLDEFLGYYSGVSASIDKDAYFDLMIRNAWKI